MDGDDRHGNADETHAGMRKPQFPSHLPQAARRGELTDSPNHPEPDRGRHRGPSGYGPRCACGSQQGFGFHGKALARRRQNRLALRVTS